MNEKKKLLCEIQAQRFAADDSALFLDTHPGNKSALRYNTERRLRLAELVGHYESKYGPLTAQSIQSSSDIWNWVEGPWPWEVDA
ncbi:MAG: spore coat protein CotJB [Clostridia bacterium]|nr:spore coat protein CotJB [Clostridia bacterium]